MARKAIITQIRAAEERVFMAMSGAVKPSTEWLTEKLREIEKLQAQHRELHGVAGYKAKQKPKRR